MYKEISVWTILCDGCGRDLNGKSLYGGGEIAGWREKEGNVPDCEAQGWIAADDAHYCPDCYYYDDEDNVVFVKNLK